MRSSFNRRLEEWREYTEISGVAEIARRAFANNSFDGVLTMMGVVMGNFVVGVDDPAVVLITGISTAVAIGISGGWGAYLTESAERRHAMVELERSILTPLGESKIGRASRMAVWVVAAVDGLSPFLSAFFVVIPFLFATLLPGIEFAYYASIALALVGLFGLGVYLAYIAHVPKLKLGLKTMIAGIVSIAVSFGIELITP
jgi:predicted membrane protein (TIGR00267 family)